MVRLKVRIGVTYLYEPRFPKGVTGLFNGEIVLGWQGGSRWCNCCNENCVVAVSINDVSVWNVIV